MAGVIFVLRKNLINLITPRKLTSVIRQTDRWALHCLSQIWQGFSVRPTVLSPFRQSVGYTFGSIDSVKDKPNINQFSWLQKPLQFH